MEEALELLQEREEDAPPAVPTTATPSIRGVHMCCANKTLYRYQTTNYL